MDPMIRYLYYGLLPEYVVMTVAVSVISLAVLLITLFGVHSYLINLVFSLILLFIFSFYWISRDGLVSTSNVNLVALFTMLAAFNRKSDLKRILIFSFVFVVLVVTAWLWDAQILDNFDRHPVYDIFKYQFLVVLFTLFMILWVNQYHHDRDSSSEKSQLISAKINELALETEQLESQQRELEKANEQLELLVEERKEKLINSNAQISSFLDVNSNKIAPTVEELLAEIRSMENLEKELTYGDWLKQSAQKLKEAFVAVRISYSKWAEKG